MAAAAVLSQWGDVACATRVIENAPKAHALFDRHHDASTSTAIHIIAEDTRPITQHPDIAKIPRFQPKLKKSDETIFDNEKTPSNSDFCPIAPEQRRFGQMTKMASSGSRRNNTN